MSLPAGNYDEIKVEKEGTLIFEGGTYSASSIKAEKESKLVFDDASEIIIQDKIKMDKKSFLGPSDGSGISAADILIFVTGRQIVSDDDDNDDDDGDSRKKTKVEFKKESVVFANVFAPTGEIEIGKDSQATGSFIAKEVEVRKGSVVTLDSAFDPAVILFKQYKAKISELGNIRDVSDEAVVIDYLKNNVINIKSNTQNLVTDTEARDSLVSILDSALQHISNAEIDVLSLDETSTNLDISQARTDIQNFISEVELLKGTTIPVIVADVLLVHSNQILSDSLKRGAEIVDIIVGTPLIITGQLITIIDADVIRLRQIVIELELLGFSTTLDADKNSPTIGKISFFDATTSTILEHVYSQTVLSILTTIAFSEEVKNAGNQLTQEEFTILLNTTPQILDDIVNLADEIPSINFVLVSVCPVNFTVQECEDTFSNPGGVSARFNIGTGAAGGLASILIFAINECFNLSFCQVVIDEISTRLGSLGAQGIDETLFPKLIVIKNVNNDDGGTLQPNNFTIHITSTALTPPSPATLQGSPTGVEVILAGGYSVSEVPVNGYTASFSSECVSTSKPSTTKTCTITNNDIQPKLTVIKNIINDNGGSLTLSGVTLFVNGTTVTNATTNLLNAGIYQVSEEPIPNYNVSFGSDCDSNGLVTLDVGDEKTCIITNNDTPPPPITFFEDFDDGDISDWNGCNNPSSCRKGVSTSAFGNDPPSSPFWGFVGPRDGSPGSCTTQPVTQSLSKFFTVDTSGDYIASGTVVANPCSGCTITAIFSVDGVPIVQKAGQRNPPFDPDAAILSGSKIISLNAGTHVAHMISQASRTCSGVFISSFDNLSIKPAGVQPLSSSSSAVGGPYFYVEVEPSTVNATRSSTEIIPFEVEWFDGFYANDVQINLIGNTTNIGITPSVVSVSNSTNLKLFDLILEIPDSAIIGNHFIDVVVTEIDSEDTQVETIFLNIE